MIAATFSSLLVAASTLTVAVEPSMTLSAPRGAQHVEMLGLSLKADCTGDIAVEEVRLRRRGLGFATDIAAVYAEMEGLRVSNSATAARDGSIDLRLSRVAVDACGSANLTIFMDLSAEADVASEHRIELRGQDAVTAPGVAVKLSSVPASVRTVRTAGDTTGSVAVEYLRLLKPVRYGTRRVVARLKLSVSGNRAQEIRRIVFTNAGSAKNMDLRMISLRDARGQRLSSTVDHLQGDRVVILLDPPLRIERGGTRTVELTADVMASVRKTVRLLIEEPGDLISEEARGRR
ncbi:MAG: hypothetical protein AAB544_05745 [Patescibacteria group bacterium]